MHKRFHFSSWTPRCHNFNGVALTVASLFLVAVPAFADGPGWSANSTVVKLVVTASGGINVMLSPSLSNCVSASGYGPYYASIYPEHPGINRMKADLLYAYATGTKVALYLSDGSCKVGEMILGGW